MNLMLVNLFTPHPALLPEGEGTYNSEPVTIFNDRVLFEFVNPSPKGEGFADPLSGTLTIGTEE